MHNKRSTHSGGGPKDSTSEASSKARPDDSEV